MDTEFRKLLKGKWKYNIKGNKLICQNYRGLTHIFENRNDVFFQEMIATLTSRGKPDPTLTGEYEKPIANVSLEQFHRILRANEVIYEKIVSLKETSDGLFCFSEHTNDFQLNHYEYRDEVTVHIDPQRMCKVTRRIRDRERVRTRIRLTSNYLVLECEFPWTVLTTLMPAIKG